MPSSPSPLLRLELQANGENSNTWGARLNTALLLLENAIAKRQSIVLGGSDVTLSTSNYADDQARSLCLALSGALSANVNVIVPALSKMYLVDNGTTNSFTVTIKTASGTGVTVAQGDLTLVYCDGTNVKALKALPTGTAYALTNVAQGFTAGQATTVVTLTDAPSITLNAAASNKFRVVLGGNRVLENPTNPVNGQTIEVLVVQDGTGSRTLTYGSKIIWPASTPPVLTTTANRGDLLIFSYDATSDKWLGSSILDYPL